MTLDGAIEASNAAWSSVLGYCAQEIEHQRFIDLVHPADRTVAQTELGHHVRSSFSARCRAKDGTYRVLHWRAMTAIAPQRIYAIGHAEPATLPRTERLLAFGQLALGVVHDLKNVLVHPLGLQLQRADRALTEKSAGKAREAIAAMRAILRDGLDALERMLRFGRTGAPAPFERVDLENVTWRATEIARAYMRSVTTLRELELTYEPGKPKRIEGDGFELLAALVNVMINAVDAVAEQGSKVAVRTGQMTARRRVWVEVVDDGPGMSSDVRTRIFEPFYTTKRDGIGIGLAMVRACVERHAGAIEIDSELGRGTRLRIELPMP